MGEYETWLLNQGVTADRRLRLINDNFDFDFIELNGYCLIETLIVSKYIL